MGLGVLAHHLRSTLPLPPDHTAHPNSHPGVSEFQRAWPREDGVKGKACVDPDSRLRAARPGGSEVLWSRRNCAKSPP